MDNRLVAGLGSLSVTISAEVAQKELIFLDEMLHWNQRVNLTAIRDRQEAIEKHLIDSLAILPRLGSGSLLDMGSGAGLPGIALAIADAGLQVTSVDSVGKKINFQKHIKRKLQLENLQPTHSRLEDLNQVLPQGSEFDYIVARAFSSLEVIVRFADPWLANAGELLVMKGPEGLQEFSDSQLNLENSGYYLAESAEYRLPFSSAMRQLIILKKLPG